MNLSHNLEASAFFFLDRPAVREAGMEITYAELNDRANRIATGLLSMGGQPGDHVGLCAPNSPDWIAFYFGVLKAGAVAVTLSGLLAGSELANLVNHARPRFVFATGTRLRDLEALKSPDGLEKVICTGGGPEPQALDAPGLWIVQGSRQGPDRHRRCSLHRRHDGHPQRRRADPRGYPFFKPQRRLL